ncbi:ABC transporter ATP-binding protein [Szabonella alba]|uniref:ABC transporter ATP-binding protein n=1 Tax=Szabonella alba TaxID=2804194 RepID=A0A8K0Y1S2_9RHOB|nr:ABC transporter ATP-binding protein [Szabonella alba]MBL4918483.1 ABC transporter ATP-binding protein [Szabonella alba]
MEGVAWRAGGWPVVEDIALHIREGETFGLIGPNGSGKSTLLRLIAGVLTPAAGMIRLDGQAQARLSRRCAARMVAFVAQQAETSERVTVRDAVELGRTPWISMLAPFGGRDDRVVTRALQQVGTAALADRYWHGLSGGERQRVHLARALAQEPRILLLDEPTNHLDFIQQLSILRLVRSLGVTAMVALHDLNQALKCDRIGVMQRGRLVACGPPRDILTPDLMARVFDVRGHFVTDPTDGHRFIRFTLPEV